MHAARSRCTALCFIFLLAGSEVRAVRDSTEYEEVGELANEYEEVGEHEEVAKSTLFANDAQRQARVEEVRQQLRDALDSKLDVGASKICESKDLAKEKAEYTRSILALQAEVAVVRSYLKSNNNAVTTKWGTDNANKLMGMVKKLTPCLEVETSGKMKGVAIDQEFKTLLKQGPQGAEADEVSAEHPEISYVMRMIGEGAGGARAAVMATEMLRNYRKKSKCMLGEGVQDRPLDTAFKIKPACTNDCADPKLNVNNLPVYEGKSPAQIEAALGSCEAPTGDQILTYGSHGWKFGCGNRMMGSTRSCGQPHGYSSCCCKKGLLNGDTNDVDKNNGCTKQCTAQDAKLQRSTQHRVQLIMDEFNGADCDYSYRMDHVVQIASQVRTGMEKTYYEKATGANPGLEQLDQQEGALIQTQAEEHVNREESEGALLEVDTEDPFTIALIIFIIFCIFIFCMSFPELCIFLIMWNYMFG